MSEKPPVRYRVTIDSRGNRKQESFSALNFARDAEDFVSMVDELIDMGDKVTRKEMKMRDRAQSLAETARAGCRAAYISLLKEYYYRGREFDQWSIGPDTYVQVYIGVDGDVMDMFCFRIGGCECGGECVNGETP